MSDDIIFSPTFWGGFGGWMYSGDHNVQDDSDILYLNPVL